LGAGGTIRLGMTRIRPSKGLDDFIPSGSLLTGAADTYPAAPETPASQDKLIHPFPGSIPNACHGSPHFVQHKMISEWFLSSYISCTSMFNRFRLRRQLTWIDRMNRIKTGNM
jgi:hypothetical protein